MTGNRNAWRAPLAGLASVAMLATMGVAAGTANAADVAIKLDANGGNLGVTELTDADGKFEDLYNTKPTAAASGATQGKTFTGWYPSASAGQAVGPDTQLTDGQTLYAHWTTNTKGITFKNADIVAQPIAFEAQSASGSDYNLLLATGDTAADWQIPSKDLTSNASSVLKGWSTTGTAPAITDFSTIKDGDTLNPINAPAATISFNGDVWTDASDGSVVSTKKVEVGAAGAAPVVYNSTGTAIVSQWTDANGDKKTALDFSKVTGPVTVEPLNPTPAYKLNISVKAFDQDGKDIASADIPSYENLPGASSAPYALIPATKGTAVDLSNLKGFETLEGFTFDGWYTDAATKTKVDTSKAAEFAFAYTGDTATVYAKFTKDKPAPVTKEVTFDPYYDGATVTKATLTVGEPFGTLPAPTREGFKLVGWYTVPNPVEGTNNAITPSQTYGGAYTYFYAKWEIASHAEFEGLLNLQNKTANGNGTLYTASSFAAYTKAVTDLVAEANKAAAGSINGAAPNYKVDYTKVSDADVTEYVKALQTAKDKLRLATEDNAFSDVNALTPFENEINRLAAEGITAGFPDGTFHPATGVNRQDFAAFLYRLAGSPDYTVSAEDNKFADVTASTPHYKEILWGAKNGIINGYTDGTFKGQDLVSRADAAAFLYRVAKNYGNDTAKKRAMDFDPSKYAGYFSDEASTAHKTEVMWAVAEGIVKGYPNGTFQGGNTILRQDAAAFIVRTIDNEMV